MHDEKIAKLSKECLLKSHLETYIRNQLKLVDSRYQVLQNLLKEVTNKVTEIAEVHNNFSKKAAVAADFLKKQSDELNQLVNDADDDPKERRAKLAERVKQLQALSRRNQEEGQGLVQAAIYSGEKALLSTPGGGRDVINMEMHDIQSKWDRFLVRVQESLAEMETKLLRAQESEATIAKTNQWLTDQEARLEDVHTRRGRETPGMSEESSLRATLRRLHSILQDVTAQEHTIEAADRQAKDLANNPQLKKRCVSKVPCRIIRPLNI